MPPRPPLVVHAAAHLALSANGTNTLVRSKQLCSALQGDQSHSPTDPPSLLPTYKGANTHSHTSCRTRVTQPSYLASHASSGCAGSCSRSDDGRHRAAANTAHAELNTAQVSAFTHCTWPAITARTTALTMTLISAQMTCTAGHHLGWA